MGGEHCGPPKCSPPCSPLTRPKNDSSQAPELPSKGQLPKTQHCDNKVCNTHHTESLLQNGLSVLEWGTVENPQIVPQRTSQLPIGQRKNWPSLWDLRQKLLTSQLVGTKKGWSCGNCEIADPVVRWKLNFSLGVGKTVDIAIPLAAKGPISNLGTSPSLTFTLALRGSHPKPGNLWYTQPSRDAAVGSLGRPF